MKEIWLEREFIFSKIIIDILSLNFSFSFFLFKEFPPRKIIWKSDSDILSENRNFRDERNFRKRDYFEFILSKNNN